MARGTRADRARRREALKRRLRISAEAEAEAAEAWRWYEKRRLRLGRDFLLQLDQALALIESNPAAGSRPPGISDPDIRRIVLPRFPYDVVYLLLPDRIQVLAIAHERRRPAYWKERIRD